MTGWLAILIVTGTAVLSVFGVIAVRRRFAVEVLEKQHEVGGFLYNALAVIYGILLAFVVFVVWTSYQSTSDAVASEADQLVDLLRLSEGFAPEVSAEIRESLRRYSRSVVDEEWPAMREGRESPGVEREIEGLWRVYVRPASTIPRDSPLYSESLQHVSRLADARRARLSKSGSRIPAMLWVLLLAGGLVMILFTYFFGTRNLRAQILMTAALASQIAFILFLVAAIDRPFDGAMRIEPRAYEKVMQRIEASSRRGP